ncbi:tRNA-specific adenosine deaminase protein 3-like [Tropilaelaps mercedesae]|uniref:tRNA-specific adenosine deaminase protein 3-like n=1 Tax=Tropilaelaps mercedesae TaxID=418985 RepID=A0A1V9X1T4_9ACAR|nr:tRNA-specific adenosine deaminase protein 3-like [Tropilaelaps mercedesae]
MSIDERRLAVIESKKLDSSRCEGTDEMTAPEPPAVKKARLELIPVLPLAFVRPVQRTKVFIASVMDRKFTSSIVRSLSDQFPLRELQHLKRVRKNGDVLEVILCQDAENVQAAGDCAKPGLDLSSVREHEVSLHAPLTREQFEECLKFWPTQFHEDKLTRSILDGTLFSADDREQMERCMRVVLSRAHNETEVMTAKHSLQDCISSGRVLNVAAIVNPRNGVVLAVGVDRTAVHPALHATMAAIDLIATLQGGGAWDTDKLLGVRDVDKADQVVESPDIHSSSVDIVKTPYICTGALYDVRNGARPFKNSACFLRVCR